MTRPFNKVFCIGFNKTGTSSMHRLFTELGLRSFHGYYSHIPVTDPLYRDFDCFSDGDQHDYALLDRTFPGSRFIVTTRRLDDWLVSRIRHVEMRRSLGATGPMRQEYEADPPSALRRWVARRLAYHQAVMAYFAARPGTLLVIDICTGRDAARACARITGFLGVPPREGLELPHENALRPDAPVSGVRGREEVRKEVRAAFHSMGLPPEQHAAVFP
ncbi:MAG: hypothetical protein JNK40_06615 [Chromatiales bacterium]|nr:hypothetical protein [Chromatiales bacterium]